MASDSVAGHRRRLRSSSMGASAANFSTMRCSASRGRGDLEAISLGLRPSLKMAQVQRRQCRVLYAIPRHWKLPMAQRKNPAPRPSRLVGGNVGQFSEAPERKASTRSLRENSFTDVAYIGLIQKTRPSALDPLRAVLILSVSGISETRRCSGARASWRWSSREGAAVRRVGRPSGIPRRIASRNLGGRTRLKRETTFAGTTT